MKACWGGGGVQRGNILLFFTTSHYTCESYNDTVYTDIIMGGGEG